MRTSRLTVLFLAALGCHHDPQPATPTEPVPLPPASGSVIGLLVDDAGPLALRDEQIVRLREIDARLDVELHRLDGGAPHPHPSEGAAGGSGGGHRGGGRHGGGMRGGMGGGMGGGGRGHRGMGGGQGAPSGDGAPSPDDKDAVARTQSQREESMHAALRDALGLLDGTQRTKAIELFTEHDVTVPSDLTGSSSSPAPAPTAPAEGSGDPAPEP